MHIQTYEQLEALALIGTDSTADWTAAALAVRVPMAEAAAVEALEQLTREGLLVKTATETLDSYRCHAESAAVVGRLAESHHSHRIELMSLMTRNAIDRVRASALHTFASAFIVGKRRDS
jgi:hypothetical protein